MTTSLTANKIIVALDFDALAKCDALVEQLDPARCRVKVGKEMFTLFGPSIVDRLQCHGFDVFLDLKFHDIPNTVAKAVKAAAAMNVWMLNVHASGGREMMCSAKNELDRFRTPPLLIGVTMLTSLSSHSLIDMGISGSVSEQVYRLARLAHDCQLDGVVSSAHETKKIKQMCGDAFISVTPGIRPAFSSKGDQHRVMTPSQAVKEGSDFLVIGRPITAARHPQQSLDTIYTELTALDESH